MKNKQMDTFEIRKSGKIFKPFGHNSEVEKNFINDEFALKAMILRNHEFQTYTE